MTRLITRVALSLCLLAALCACKTVGTPVQSTSEEVATTHITYAEGRAKLVIGDKALLGNIVLNGVKFGQVGKLTRSAVTIQNLSDEYYHVEYNIEWFDQDGFPVESFSSWQQADLTPNMLMPLQFVGKSPKAWGYVLNMRAIGGK